MAAPQLKSIHYEGQIPKDPSKPFSISCSPRTDIWNKPPSTHSFNAPIIYYALPSLRAFKSAEVTVTASWKDKYDQGGLCLVVSPTAPGHQQIWVKSGIEILNGQPHVGTVATKVWSDWSLRPVPDAADPRATIKIEYSEEDGSLWVYLKLADGSYYPLREVAWWPSVEKGLDCWIGVYAAKPADVQDSLEVHFENFSVESDVKG